MIGFNFKSLVLQVIHGSIIIVALYFSLGKGILSQVIIELKFISSNETLLLTLLIFLSYSIGILIDFLADILESFVFGRFFKPPIYYLLSKSQYCGVTLAHKDYILNELCVCAAVHDNNINKEDIHKLFLEGEKKEINYILQVAKNKAFSDYKESQKEQQDSFFMLYIFSRNLSLSLIISVIILLFYISDEYLNSVLNNDVVIIGVGLTIVLSLLASHRFYLYYTRILLGSTFKEMTYK